MNKSDISRPILMLWQMFLLVGVSLTLSLFSVLTFYLYFSPQAPLVSHESPVTKLQQFTMEMLSLGDYYHQAPADLKPYILADLFLTAHKRKILLEQLVKTDPAAVLRASLPLSLQQRLPGELTTRYALEEGGRVLGEIFPPAMRQQLPFSLVPELEEQVTVEGELEVLHADYFEHGLALHEYAVRDAAGRRLVLNFAADAPQLMSGSRVKVKGIRVGQQMAVTRGRGADFEVTFEAQPGHTVKKVAIILFNFSDNTSQPASPDTVRQLVFTGSPSVNGYYREASFGNLSLEGKLRPDGDVFGWFPIAYPSSPCSYSTWASAAQTAAAAQGFTAQGYNHIIYAFPRSSACGWAGLGTVGGNPGTVWINGNFTIATIGHELGHNLGAHHASALNCIDSAGARITLSSICTTSEYGDPFDIMAVSTRHASNFHKGRLNWLPPENTLTITQSGTYTLAPQEPPYAGTQVLRLPRDFDTKGNVTAYYYLEYRQPFGQFDNFSTSSPVVKGISIRLAPPYTTLQQSRLLDMVPFTASFSDSALVVGATFTDSEKNIKITTIAADSQSAQVRIDLGDLPPPCLPSAPQVTLNPLAQWGVSGQTLTYELSVTSTDSAACAPAVYNLNVALPAGFTQSASPLSVTLSPGQTQTMALNVTSSTSSPDGFYTLTETISRITGESASVALSYNISNPPADESASGAGDTGTGDTGSGGGDVVTPSASLQLSVPSSIYLIKNRANLTAVAKVTDNSGQPVPNVPVTITIYRPDGSVAVTKTLSTSRRTGEASLSYKLKSTDNPGAWPATVTATIGANILQDSGAFTVQ